MQTATSNSEALSPGPGSDGPVAVKLSTHPRLRHDALWNVAGSVIYAGCQWGILVATVKLSSPADVGRLSLGFAITAPIFLLLHLRLRAATATDAGLDFTPANYILLRAVTTALAVAVTLAVCAGTRLPAASSQVVVWVAAAKAIESGSDLLYGFAQQANDLRSVAISMTARGLLSQLFFAGLLGKTHRLDYALAGLCAAWLLVFLLIDLPLGVRRFATLKSGPQLQPVSDGPVAINKMRSLRQLAIVTLPLGLSTMFMSLMANTPRYFVQHALGLEALGIFSAAAYLTMTVSVIISAIAEAGLAPLARHFLDGSIAQANHMLRRLLRVTLLLSGLAIGTSLVAGKLILNLAYVKVYGDAAGLLTALMFVAALANLSSVLGYALVAARRFVRYLGALAGSALCTALACALLVPRWGNYGAAGACMIGYGVQLLASWLLLRPFLCLVAPCVAAANNSSSLAPATINATINATMNTTINATINATIQEA